jgi:N-acetylmuramoyl-L-alanine amidase
MFAPDSRIVERVVPSPNHGERRGVTRPDMLLLHYTGMPDTRVALEKLCDKASGVSAHYFVFEDGGGVQLVPETRRAWHAGEASWAGETDINSRSIGIEIANPGHGWDYRDFLNIQIEAVIALCRDVLTRQPIPPHRVLAHSDVAPTRKQDPGEKFPWHSLANSGVGHWVHPAPIVRGETLKLGAEGDGVRSMQEALKRYGYGIEVTGKYDAPTVEVVTAFQRHFRPERVDGIADHSTLTTLESLLASLLSEAQVASR